MPTGFLGHGRLTAGQESTACTDSCLTHHDQNGIHKGCPNSFAAPSAYCTHHLAPVTVLGFPPAAVAVPVR